MTSIPKCGCGIHAANKEVSRGCNRGRWYWKCAKNICGFFKFNECEKSTYTFTPYTIPRRPTSRPVIGSPSSKPYNRAVLDLGRCTSLSGLGSGTEKSRSRRQTERISVRLALYTNTDISVQAQGRHNYLQTIFNTIAGMTWIGELQLWVFSADQQTYQQVWAVLQQHRALFDATGVPVIILKWLPKSPQALQEQLQQNNNGNDSLDDDFTLDLDSHNSNKKATYPTDNDQSAIDDSKMKADWILGSKLWQAMAADQRSRVKNILDMDGHVYLKNTVGSANSLQALGVALANRDNWPVLIICRASVCQKWKVLVQDMLQLEHHQVSNLDRVSSSDSRQKPKQPKKVGIQVSNVNKSSPMATFGTTPRRMAPKRKTATTDCIRKKDGFCIRLLDDSGDAPPARSSIHEAGYVTSTKKQHQKVGKVKNRDFCIRLRDNSGDYHSDIKTIGSTDNRAHKIGTKINSTNRSLNGPEQSGSNDRHTQRNNRKTSKAAHFQIINYKHALAKLGALTAKKYKVIIFDDCHDLIGTWLPSRKSSLHNLVNASKKTIMLSAAPVFPKPIEIFPLLQILKPNVFIDKKYFTHRYCGAKQGVLGWNYLGSSNSFELEYLLNKIVLV